MSNSGFQAGLVCLKAGELLLAVRGKQKNSFYSKKKKKKSPTSIPLRAAARPGSCMLLGAALPIAQGRQPSASRNLLPRGWLCNPVFVLLLATPEGTSHKQARGRGCGWGAFVCAPCSTFGLSWCEQSRQCRAGAAARSSSSSSSSPVLALPSPPASPLPGEATGDGRVGKRRFQHRLLTRTGSLVAVGRRSAKRKKYIYKYRGVEGIVV